MSNFLGGLPVKQIENEKRRAAILRHLMDSPNNEAGHLILAEGCRALGIVSTPQDVIAAIGWLESLGLVSVERIGDVTLAGITREGKAVVRGHVTVTGVTTPTDFD